MVTAEPSSAAKAPHLIVAVQALRALAAYATIMVHLAVLFAPLGIGETVLAIGNAGVDLFFVISGFIMVWTTRGGEIGPVDFLKNRIARVVPSYWLITLSLFLIGSVAPSLLGGTHATLPHLLQSLFFLPYTREDGQMLPLLFVGWTLNYEMAFYILFAVALIVRRRLPYVALAATAILATVLAGAIVTPRSAILVFYAAPIIIEFAFGMLLALAYVRLEPDLASLPYAIAGLLFGTIILLGSWLLERSTGAAIMAAVGATMIVAGALTLEQIGRWPRMRFLTHMGNASYALYLTHPFVTQLITQAAAKLDLLTPAFIPLLAVGAYGGASIVALTYYRFIEAPSSRATKRLLGIRNARRAGGL